MHLRALLPLTLLLGFAAVPAGSLETPDGKPVVRFLIGSRGAFNQLGFIQEYDRALTTIDIVPVESTRGPGRLIEIQLGEADVVINASQAAVG